MKLPLSLCTVGLKIYWVGEYIEMLGEWGTWRGHGTSSHPTLNTFLFAFLTFVCF